MWWSDGQCKSYLDGQHERGQSRVVGDVQQGDHDGVGHDVLQVHLDGQMEEGVVAVLLIAPQGVAQRLKLGATAQCLVDAKDYRQGRFVQPEAFSTREP